MNKKKTGKVLSFRFERMEYTHFMSSINLIECSNLPPTQTQKKRTSSLPFRFHGISFPRKRKIHNASLVQYVILDGDEWYWMLMLMDSQYAFYQIHHFPFRLLVLLKKKKFVSLHTRIINSSQSSFPLRFECVKLLTQDAIFKMFVNFAFQLFFALSVSLSHFFSFVSLPGLHFRFPFSLHFILKGDLYFWSFIMHMVLPF